MASKTFYFLDALATGSNYLQLQDEGSPPVQARISTGWIVGTVAATVYANMDSQTERATTALTGTALPNLPPNNTLGDSFRTQNRYQGNFALGNWGFNFQVEGETRATSTTDGRLRLKVWKSANVNGSSATEITSGTAIVTSQFVNLANTAFQNITGVASLSAFSLNNEYLFFQVAFQLDGAGNNANADVHLAVGSGNRFNSTNFVSTAPQSASLSKTLDNETLSSSGKLTDEADTVKTLSNITFSSNGAVATSSRLSKTLEVLTLSSNGIVENPVLTATGNLNVTFENIAFVSTGQVQQNSLLSKTLDNVLSSSILSSSISGITFKTLDDVVFLSNVINSILSSLSKTLENITNNLVGIVSNEIDLSKTLDSITNVSNGSGAIGGSSDETLGNDTFDSEVDVAINSNLSKMLENISFSNASDIDIIGVLSSILGDATLSSSGVVGSSTNIASLNVTLENLLASSVGKVNIGSDLSKILGNIINISNGSNAIGGSTDETLEIDTFDAEADVDIYGNSSISLADILFSSTGITGAQTIAILNSTLDNVLLSSSGVVAIDGDLSVMLAVVTLVADGTLTTIPVAPVLVAALKWKYKVPLQDRSLKVLKYN